MEASLSSICSDSSWATEKPFKSEALDLVNSLSPVFLLIAGTKKNKKLKGLKDELEVEATFSNWDNVLFIYSALRGICCSISALILSFVAFTETQLAHPSYSAYSCWMALIFYQCHNNDWYFPVSVVSRKSTPILFLYPTIILSSFTSLHRLSLLNKTVETEKTSPSRWQVVRKKGLREKKKNCARCDIQFTSVDITLTH